MDVAIETVTSMAFDEAVRATREALVEKGFRILHEFDLDEVLGPRGGAAAERAHVLAACAPEFARRSFEVNRDVALLLPRNVVIREVGGGCVIQTLNPALMAQAISGGLHDLTDDLTADLVTIMKGLGPR